MENSKNTIEYVAYIVKKAKRDKQPKPIIFLGAGASVTAGIPLTDKIVADVKAKHKDNPVIKSMIASGENNYYEIMGALESDDRKDLFYEYITNKKVKINVTNIYLAQLLKEGYIDYIVTVNFDDLILRACALFNFLPPVYDISNVKLPTTSNYREKSVIYLHGQHYGQWLLNDEEELKKVKEDVAKVFGEITTKRSWIVVGYSGQDEIFNQLVNLGSFSKGLFWVNYLNSMPAENVSFELLNKSITNAHLINGYDSDSFFLKLHSEIEDLKTPEVFNKPFSFLKEIISNVKDIETPKDDNTHKDLFLDVKERMDITNRSIDRAITEIENEDSVDKFKQEIIEAYLKSKFKENEKMFLKKIKQERFEEAKEELSEFYFVWGNEIYEEAKLTSNEDLYRESFEKYKEAIKLNPKYDSVYYNYGIAICALARLTSDEDLYKKSFEKYKESIKLNPNDDFAYNNYGIAICALARLTSNENLYKESFEKYEKAIELNSKEALIYYNYGTNVFDLAKLTSDRKLYEKSLKLLKKGYELGGSGYNLACAYALMGDKEDALMYLKENLDKKFKTKKEVLEDEDWKEYLEDEDFIEIIESY